MGIMAFIVGFIVAIVYDCLKINSIKNYQVINDLGTFVACEITLSSVIISIFGFILSGLDARYMGLSTKVIAFRNLIFQFNAIRCLWIVILADVWSEQIM